jgi:hypothetical protein
MSDQPAHRFTIESYADCGAFVVSPHLRWWHDGGEWASVRPGDLILESVAVELAWVAQRADFLATQHEDFQAIIAASRERIAALRAHLLTRGHEADCTWPHPSYGPDYGCSCGWLAALGEEATDGE